MALVVFQGKLVATTYHYRLFDLEFGPIPFPDLVELVRLGRIGTDDLTRADWEADWHPAAEIVGLFHMAGRAEALARWEAAQHARAMNSQAAAVPDGPTEGIVEVSESTIPGWQLRLQELRERNSNSQGAAEEVQEVDLQEAITAATEASDTRTTLRKRLFPAIQPQTQARLTFLFRWGTSLLAANGVGWGVLQWSRTEELRFPRSPDQSAVIFPVYGQCSLGEYVFLMTDVMVIAVVAGYWTARMIELQLDS